MEVAYFRLFMRLLVLVAVDRIPWDLKILWTKCGLEMNDPPGWV